MGSQDYDFGASLCVNLTSQGAKSNKVPLRKEGRSEYGGSLRRLSSKLLDDHNWYLENDCRTFIVLGGEVLVLVCRGCCSLGR